MDFFVGKPALSMKMQGRPLSGVTLSTTTVELVNGAPVVTALTGDSSVQ